MWYETFYVEPKLDKNEINNIKKLFNPTQNVIEEYSLTDVEKLILVEDKEKYFEQKNSFFILEEEYNLVKLLSKYNLHNNYLKTDFFLNILDILLIINNILSKRLNLPEVVHKNKTISNFIPRCSYKFCNFKHECYYNYNLKNCNICYQDHYVHNMIKADLIILKKYIKNYFPENNVIIPNREILKSISTLNYVVEHMYLEMKSRCLYLTEDEYEKQHFIKKNLSN